MVRISLPNRLKSFNGGGTHSASHSRSTSPNPNGSMKRITSADGGGEKGTGLMLKVVVIKVGFPAGVDFERNKADWDFCRLATSRRRIRVVLLTQ